MCSAATCWLQHMASTAAQAGDTTPPTPSCTAPHCYPPLLRGRHDLLPARHHTHAHPIHCCHTHCCVPRGGVFQLGGVSRGQRYSPLLCGLDLRLFVQQLLLHLGHVLVALDLHQTVMVKQVCGGVGLCACALGSSRSLTLVVCSVIVSKCIVSGDTKKRSTVRQPSWSAWRLPHLSHRRTASTYKTPPLLLPTHPAPPPFKRSLSTSPSLHSSLWGGATQCLLPQIAQSPSWLPPAPAGPGEGGGGACMLRQLLHVILEI